MVAAVVPLPRVDPLPRPSPASETGTSSLGFTRRADGFFARIGGTIARIYHDGAVELGALDTARCGYRTRVVRIGDFAVPAPLPAELDADGSVVLRRDTLVERFFAREGGVEQSWTFADKPTASGDMVIEVERLDRSGARCRYGEATWIDAAGTRARVASRIERGAVHLTVPETVWTTSRFPAVLDPLISEEVPLDTDPKFNGCDGAPDRSRHREQRPGPIVRGVG
jgi:hypothetical protein